MKKKSDIVDYKNLLALELSSDYQYQIDVCVFANIHKKHVMGFCEYGPKANIENEALLLALTHSPY